MPYYERKKDNFKQIIKDIRNIELDDLDGIDYIIHLAGLSNDPLGELEPGLTEEINFHGTMRIAELAKRIGVKKVYLRIVSKHVWNF